MRRIKEPVTIENLRAAYEERRFAVAARLAEFREVWRHGTDDRLWEELVFCIFTAGASARMGVRSIEAIRSLLRRGTHRELADSLRGVHRYPVARSGYIVVTRDYLEQECELRLRQRLDDFRDPFERRDWLAREPCIKGLGYKEASHFLRNIGLDGYGILDKHILRSLAELGVIESPDPPNTRTKYLLIEEKMRRFARDIGIDFDELDLLLWSLKTGEILK